MIFLEYQESTSQLHLSSFLWKMIQKINLIKGFMRMKSKYGEDCNQKTLIFGSNNKVLLTIYLLHGNVRTISIKLKLCFIFISSNSSLHRFNHIFN